MTSLSRRRGRDEDPEDERDEGRGRSRRSSRGDDDGGRRGSRRSRDEDDEPRDEGRGRSRRSRDENGESEDRGRRSEGRSRGRGSRSRGGDDEGESRGRSRGKGTGGFGQYSAKRQSNSKFADEFKPADDTPTLIKILDDGPFDVYNQHWIEEGDAAGKTRHSFVCMDDVDYFGDDAECPLCEIGESSSTYALFNILNLGNPRKPKVEVWKCGITVADILTRMAGDKKTSPLDRDDLYFEVTRVKGKNKVTWEIHPVKERDLEEDYDMEPLDPDEIEDFLEDRFDDRKAIQAVDSYDDLADLADSLD